MNLKNVMKILEKQIKILRKNNKETIRKQDDYDVRNIKRKRQTDGGGEKEKEAKEQMMNQLSK